MKRRLLSTHTIIKSIKGAANSYKTNLVGRTFLYVFDNRFIEVICKSKNFKHLTGVESSLSSKDFYSNALKGRLTEYDISFSDKHPYSLCEKKILHISELAELALGECFLLETVTTNTFTYAFGTSDLDFTLLFDSDKDEIGNLISEKYVVRSIRDEDCFDRSKNVFSVTHIFSKKNDEKIYNNVIYLDEKHKNEVPDEVLGMVSDKIKQSLEIKDK